MSSLSITDQKSNRLSRLIQLRASIVEYESAKQQLIEIVEAHIDGSVSRSVAGTDLRLTEIPDVVKRINWISGQLSEMATDGDMFAAERSFKLLKLTLDARKMDVLCRLSREAASASPDVVTMTDLVKRLKDELKNISGAEEALATYIKQRTNSRP